MNYDETIEYIHRTPKFSRELGNRMLKKLLGFLGNPQDELKFVHIAGTNGKGSTAVMINEILISAGYRTGLFTSPYIHRFNERIKVNNTEIPDEELAEIVTQIREKIENYDAPVSEFALDTAAAFCYFKKMNCDIVVLETVRRYLSPIISAGCDTLILGCTHYPVLEEAIRRVTEGNIALINPGVAVSEAVSDFIKSNALESSNNAMGIHNFYVSDKPDSFKLQASVLLGEELDDSRVEQVDLSTL